MKGYLSRDKSKLPRVTATSEFRPYVKTQNASRHVLKMLFRILTIAVPVSLLYVCHCKPSEL